MKTTDLVHSSVYGLMVRSSDWMRPALVLDTKPWMHGQKTVRKGEDLVRVYELVPAPKQRLKAEENPYTDFSVGIPVLVLNHSALRWFSDQEDEHRIVTPPRQVLERAAEGVRLEETQDLQTSAPRLHAFKVSLTMADGRQIEADAQIMLVRPQHLIGAWSAELKEQDANRQAHLARVSESDKVRTRADLLDHQIADRVDHLLGPVARLEYNGLRPDVVRLRGAGEFQVSEELLLRLLELAERHH